MVVSLERLLGSLHEQIDDLSRFESPLNVSRGIKALLRTAETGFAEDEVVRQLIDDIRSANAEYQKLEVLRTDRGRILHERIDDWMIQRADRLKDILVIKAALFEKLTVLSAASLGVLVSSLGIMSNHTPMGLHLQARSTLFVGMGFLILALLGSLTGYVATVNRTKATSAEGNAVFDLALRETAAFVYTTSETSRRSAMEEAAKRYDAVTDQGFSDKAIRRLGLSTLGRGTTLEVLVVFAIVASFVTLAIFLNANLTT
jgi:hypothetical protein